MSRRIRWERGVARRQGNPPRVALPGATRDAEEGKAMTKRASEYEHPHEEAHASTSRGERWWGMALGILVGAIDTFGAAALGVHFSLGGTDVTWVVWLYLSLSFGVLGFLIGYLHELRRKERRMEAVMRSQMESVHRLETRLSHNEKLATLGQMVGQIAHEVRNPLAIIRCGVQNLHETLPPDDPDAAQSCDFVLEEIDRLNNVISSLLHLIRPLKLETQTLPSHGLFQKTTLLVRRLYPPEMLSLRSVEALSLPPLQGDEDLLCQVLLGLLTNAVQAADGQADVTLSARQDGGFVALEVSDLGPGVDPTLHEEIFTPLFTTRSEGNGFGLAIARQIVEAHGGSLTLDDSYTDGARFVLRLPLAEKTPEASEASKPQQYAA